MENTVFVELMRKGKQVFYWKNKGEVDFVIKGDKKVEELIQVCYDVEDPKTKEREVKALLEAMKFFRLRTGIIVTWDYEDEERINGKKISYIPIWKWLLLQP
jgi:predicted AAA+ superfamily ATPase